MSRGCTVVTGVARHSLGEAFVRAWLIRAPGRPVIAIDRIANPDLGNLAGLRQVQLDLNPINHPGGFGAFAAALESGLTDAVTTGGYEGVECLVQCAGVYDFGTFPQHDIERRKELLGLNVLGLTEVLHTVMRLNDRAGRHNNEEFTHVDVGSFQGLYARDGRPIYAPSKAYGIDLCTSLVEGREVARCIYLAVGPIDTPMLHRNHWVRKAGGSEEFFKKVLGGSRDSYRSIFVCCDEAALEAAASEESPREAESLRVAMQRYRAKRSAAYAGPLGVLSSEDCAGALARVLMLDHLESGVYMPVQKSEGAEIVVKMATFRSLSRRCTFDCAAKVVASI
jgi:short-subunit dehydrogenase